MNVRACLSLSAAVLSLFAANAVVAQTRYTGVVLEPPSMYLDAPGDINNAGAVVGNVPGGYDVAYLRDSNGVWTELGRGTIFSGASLNERGQAVWTASFEYQGNRAYIRDGNQSRSLGTLGGTPSDASWAHDINDHGQVVGTSTYAGGSGFHAFFYDNAVMQDIGVVAGFDGTLTEARGINNSSQIVAAARVNGNIRAVLYDNGTVLDLGTLGGASATALRINDAGQVIGYSMTDDGQNHAFLYSNGTMMDLVPNSFSSYALGLNASGTVVGTYTTQQNGASIPFIYTPEYGLLDLSSLLTGPLLDEASNLFSDPYITLDQAVAINDLGQILIDAGTYAVVLTPVPVPAAGWLLGSAMMAMFGWQRRRKSSAHN